MSPAKRVLLIAGVLVVLSGSIATAMVVGGGSDAPAKTVPTTIAPATIPPTTAPPTTAPPNTARAVTTSVPRSATTRPAPPTTAAPNPPTTLSPPPTEAPTTTQPVLTRPQATKALCSDLGAAIQIVSDGNTVAGGLRLLRAVNSYGDVADPTVVAPARQILSAGLAGDLEAAGVAARAAASACARLGYPIGIVHCITAPCP